MDSGNLKPPMNANQKKSMPVKSLSGKKANSVLELKGKSKPKKIYSFEPGPKYEDRLHALLQTIAAQHNPFLEVGRILLRTLADLPKKLTSEEAGGLHYLLQSEIEEFTHLCKQSNLPNDHMIAVRYMLCAALDEAISLRLLAGESESATVPWSAMALLPQFHNDTDGGQIVFLLIGRLASAPDAHRDVLEIAHHVLSLGFRGQYRHDPNGLRTLEVIRQRLYVMVEREPVAPALSPRWQGERPQKIQPLLSLPVWVSVLVSVLLLCVQLGWYEYSLHKQAVQVQKSIEELAKFQPPSSPKPAM
jgi:type VI secretion system protein ImpK